MITKLPWPQKVQVWEMRYLQETPIDRIRGNIPSKVEQHGVVPSWQTVKQVVDEFLSLSPSQVTTLPDPLQARWREVTRAETNNTKESRTLGQNEIEKRYSTSPQQIQGYNSETQVGQRPYIATPTAQENEPISSFDKQKHKNDLLKGVIPELNRLESLVISYDDLVEWYLYRKEFRWSIRDRDFIYVKGDGSLYISLSVENTLEWKYLFQHLKVGPLQSSIESYKKAVREQVVSAIYLISEIDKRVKHEIGLPWDDLKTRRLAGPAIDFHYLVKLCEIIRFGTRDGFLKKKEEFVLSGKDTVYLDYCPVIQTPIESLRKKAIDFFIEAQDKFISLPQAQKSKLTNDDARTKAAEVRQQTDRVRLDMGFPKGSTCDGCRPWIGT